MEAITRPSRLVTTSATDHPASNTLFQVQSTAQTVGRFFAKGATGIKTRFTQSRFSIPPVSRKLPRRLRREPISRGPATPFSILRLGRPPNARLLHDRPANEADQHLGDGVPSCAIRSCTILPSRQPQRPYVLARSACWRARYSSMAPSVVSTGRDCEVGLSSSVMSALPSRHPAQPLRPAGDSNPARTAGSPTTGSACSDPYRYE
jgi:hypothetical protein